jgi:hypothetical protein
MIKIIITFLISFWTYALYASPDHWKCSVTDMANKTWTVDHQYQRSAINMALDACKKQSTTPGSCKAAKEACELFINGKSNRASWQCTALDQAAKPWVSNTYSQRADAAIAAKDYCKENSSAPGSCYVNLVTCKNLNGRP